MGLLAAQPKVAALEIKAMLTTLDFLEEELEAMVNSGELSNACRYQAYRALANCVWMKLQLDHP